MKLTLVLLLALLASACVFVPASGPGPGGGHGQFPPEELGAEVESFQTNHEGQYVDWCHDAFSDDERSTLIGRWNTYLAELNARGEFPYHELIKRFPHLRWVLLGDSGQADAERKQRHGFLARTVRASIKAGAPMKARGFMGGAR